MARRLSTLCHHVVGHAVLDSNVGSAQALTASQTAASSDAQVIVITGCTSGLGLNLAREFSKRGHTVVGCGRRADIIDKLNAAFSGTSSSFHVVDVAKEADNISLAKEVTARHGKLDVLICAAGLGGVGKMSWDIPSDQLSNIVDVSLKGLMYTNKHLIPIMLKGLETSGGPIKRVINFSSGVGHTTMPGMADYCAVKFGVEGWSKCVAQEFKALPNKKGSAHIKDRILCVPFAPGVVSSEMNKNPAAPPAEEWAPHAASFLLQLSPSDNGSSVTMPGYYGRAYMDAWVVADGAKMNDKVVRPSAK